MAITDVEEDALTCFSCYQNKPSFRLVSLNKYVNNLGGLDTDYSAALICQSCLKVELDKFHESLDQFKEPLEEWETEEHSLCRQFAISAVPLTISFEESQLLIEGLGIDELKPFSDQRSKATLEA